MITSNYNDDHFAWHVIISSTSQVCIGFIVKYDKFGFALVQTIPEALKE